MTKAPGKSVKKGLQETADGSGLIPDPRAIPDKLYFKIGEVSEITGVEPHVLRYWESEFKIIRPQRATSRQRLYRRVDVEHILTIKKLLYIDGFTVPGARRFLAEGKKAGRKRTPGPRPEKKGPSPAADARLLSELKSELLALKKILEK